MFYFDNSSTSKMYRSLVDARYELKMMMAESLILIMQSLHVSTDSLDNLPLSLCNLFLLSGSSRLPNFSSFCNE